jgi:hypothetical protein
MYFFCKPPEEGTIKRTDKHHETQPKEEKYDTRKLSLGSVTLALKEEK